MEAQEIPAELVGPSAGLDMGTADVEHPDFSAPRHDDFVQAAKERIEGGRIAGKGQAAALQGRIRQVRDPPVETGLGAGDKRQQTEDQKEAASHGFIARRTVSFGRVFRRS